MRRTRGVLQCLSNTQIKTWERVSIVYTTNTHRKHDSGVENQFQSDPLPELMGIVLIYIIISLQNIKFAEQMELTVLFELRADGINGFVRMKILKQI